MPGEKPRREVLAFARRLRILRIRRGLTQRELAALCGMAPGQVSRYEAGLHTPYASSLARLARELKVSVQTLAGSLVTGRRARAGRTG